MASWTGRPRDRNSGLGFSGVVAASEDGGELLVVAFADEDLELLDGRGVVDHALRVFALLEVLAAFTVPALHRTEHVLPGNAPNEPVAVEDGQRALHAADAQTRRA